MLQRRSFILIGLETVKPAIIFAPQSDDLTKMLRAGAWNTRLLSSSRPRQRPTDSFLTTLKNDFNLFKSVSKDVVHQKCSDAYVLYEQFSRRNEVREAREKVSKIRDELDASQKRRYQIMNELIEIRRLKNSLEGEMRNSKSLVNQSYLDLVKANIETNQLEEKKDKEYQNEVQTERDLFYHLKDSIEVSHEKENNVSTLKLWSIVGGVLNAILSIIASALTYHYRQNLNNSLADSMRHELKAIKDEIRTISNASSAESWVGFFWRKSVDSYRYFVPRQSSASSNQDRESWASFLSRKSCDSYRYFLPKN